jgi:enolase
VGRRLAVDRTTLDDPRVGERTLKSGAPARGERTAKYNRLLEIAAGSRLRYGMG